LNQEIPYFIDNYITHLLTNEARKYLPFVYNDLIAFIEITIKDRTERLAKKCKNENTVFDIHMNGVEFEMFCSQFLQKQGWKVQTTKRTGDQGVDLIITKGNRRLGVQCKKHSKPIGNKAVQEIKAGLMYYDLEEGVVIGTSTFTKAAIELASVNHIKLFHYLDIVKI
jgi:HJR/Mrr/RecB family endonuclease